MDNNLFGSKELYEVSLKTTYPIEINGVKFEKSVKKAIKKTKNNLKKVIKKIMKFLSKKEQKLLLLILTESQKKILSVITRMKFN